MLSESVAALGLVTAVVLGGCGSRDSADSLQLDDPAGYAACQLLAHQLSTNSKAPGGSMLEIAARAAQSTTPDIQYSGLVLLDRNSENFAQASDGLYPACVTSGAPMPHWPPL